MSTTDEEPYSTIFTSLKHPIRRRILRMLSKKPMSFSEMLEFLGVSSSFLTYHLENLGELVGKTDDGKYKLSSFGEAAIATMTKVEDIPTIAPQQLIRTQPKKVVGRSVAIALGIICILLIAGLGGALVYYTMIVHNKENELGSANNTISQLNTNLTNLQNQIASDNETIMNLQKIANLQESTVVLADAFVFLEFFANSSRPIILDNTETTQGIILPPNVNQLLTKVVMDYSGYVVVNITQSDSNSTFVELEYSSNGFNYANMVNIGSRGSAYFPVLPTSTLNVIVGHNDTILPVNLYDSWATATRIPIAIVTITYYY